MSSVVKINVLTVPEEMRPNWRSGSPTGPGWWSRPTGSSGSSCCGRSRAPTAISSTPAGVARRTSRRWQEGRAFQAGHAQAAAEAAAQGQDQGHGQGQSQGQGQGHGHGGPAATDSECGRSRWCRARPQTGRRAGPVDALSAPVTRSGGVQTSRAVQSEEGRSVRRGPFSPRAPFVSRSVSLFSEQRSVQRVVQRQAGCSPCGRRCRLDEQPPGRPACAALVLEGGEELLDQLETGMTRSTAARGVRPGSPRGAVPRCPMTSTAPAGAPRGPPDGHRSHMWRDDLLGGADLSGRPSRAHGEAQATCPPPLRRAPCGCRSPRSARCRAAWPTRSTARRRSRCHAPGRSRRPRCRPDRVVEQRGRAEAGGDGERGRRGGGLGERL